MQLVRNFFQFFRYLAGVHEDNSMERNIKRLGLGLSDEEFDVLMAHEAGKEKFFQFLLVLFAALVFMAVLADPVADTIALFVQNFLKVWS